MYGDDTSESGPRGTFETYRAEGDTLYKNGEYYKAIDSYTTALELRVSDKDCLVARSRCYLQMGNTEQALKDAEASLAEDANFHKGLFQKAEALYCKGEFELALVFYHRGHKMRPELQEFRLGIQKAQEAIDNSVGSPEKVKLTKDGDLSFFDVLTEPTKKPRAKPGYPRPGTNSRKQAKEYKSAVNDKTVKQLLGELYGDRVYLEKLLKETDPQSSSGQNIYNLVHAGLQYLDTRTEFWRQQKPMYARKRERITKTRMPGKGSKISTSQYLIKELEGIDQDSYDGQYKNSLTRAENCLKLVDECDDKDVENKESVRANLHSLIGNAYLELGQFDKALHHHNLDMDLAKKHKLKEARSRALDNLGRVYARNGSYLKAIEVWQEKLPLAKSPLEQTWLYHEMGRCYLEMGQYDKAKDLGEKSGVKAEVAEDTMWQLNAAVLVAQAQAKLKEYEDALGSFERALDMAVLQEDQSAESAIKRAIQDINNRIVKNLKAEKAQDDSPGDKSEDIPPEDSEQKSHSKEPKSDTSHEEVDGNSGSVHSDDET